jgi:hypothetical protein
MKALLTRHKVAPTNTRSGHELGELVHHNRFGKGRVRAHWPDGTLLVQFDNGARSRFVWPSFLVRVAGPRR